MMTDLSKFHVVCMISNPVGYKSRYELYRKFKEEMDKQGLNVWTCEVSQGDRPFAITRGEDPRVLQLRTVEELWHKENAINLMVQELPWDWQYVAIIDADVAFLSNTGPDAWYYKAVDLLQTYQVIQLFQTAIDLGPNGEALKIHEGFVYSYLTNQKKSPNYMSWHPGFAWAWNRFAWDAVGGMPDFGILGSGDRHAAYGLVGKVIDSCDKDVSEGYKQRLRAWQEQAERYVRRDIGYLPQTLTHAWHGRKKNRFYDTRWKILTECAFDPNTDIKRDYQGLWQFADHGDTKSIELRDRVRGYFRARNEDGIDND